MTQLELEKVKLAQLEIMDEIHRVCVKNNITYYIIGGTLLGAVRHKGYIPWDVDIDIAMPREEYDNFKDLCEVELNSKYAYIDYKCNRNYDRPHALVSKRNTRLNIKYDHLNPISMDRGIYIDIFPLDNAPDDESLRNKQAKKLKMVRKFKQYRLPYSYSYKRWKRWAHYLVSGLLSWIPVYRINRYQQMQMQKYRSRKTTCLCSMASQYAYAKQCMPKEIYGTPILLEFEGREYYAPNKYTEYLSRIYGEYMELPPLEKRQANLDIYSSVEFL